MRILLVGDNSGSARFLVDHLYQMGNEYQVNVVPWSLCTSSEVSETDLILVNDYKNGDCEKLVQLRRRTNLPILLISTIEDDETLVQLYASGVDDHLVQPISYPILSAKLRVWQRWTLSSVTELLHSGALRLA